MTPDERVVRVRAWARARLEACRGQESKFTLAWQLRAKHQHGPLQALVEAWTERQTLQAVLDMLGGDV